MKRGGFFTLLFLTCWCTICAQVPCGSGFKANGTDDFIGVPDTNHINKRNVENRTIEFWFKANDIFTKQILYEEGAGSKAILFYLEGGRVYCGAFKNSTWEARFFRSALGEIEVDTWVHIAMTLFDGTTFKWFLNGVQQDAQSGFSVGTHSGDINLARSDGELKYPLSLANEYWIDDTYYADTNLVSDVGNYHFDGNISLFRIWNVTRGVSDIDNNKLNYLTSGVDLVAYQTEEDAIMYIPNNGNSLNMKANANGKSISYTWNGGSSNTWANDANWSGTKPISEKAQTVIINAGTNNPNITSEVDASKLTINVGANLTIQAGGTLNVYTSLTNNGTITIEDGGSLVYHPCNTAITGTNTIVIKRNSPNYSISKKYSYWSSPLIEADADPLDIFPSSPVIWYFDASQENADWAYNSGANFIPGVGYAIRSETTGITTATFTGKLNEGEISVPIYFNSNLASTQGTVWSTAGDNLLGNPYAAALDWDVIIKDVEANSHLEGTIYFWDQTSVLIGDNDINDYKQYNLTGGTGGATGFIGSGQGFFIRTTDTSPSTFTFKPTYQKAGLNTQFYKNTKVASKKEGRSWFLLKKLEETLYSSTLIGFVKGATDYYDRLYDAPFDINNSKLGLYSIVIQPKSNQGGPPPPPNELKKASIQGLPVLSSIEKVISLGVVVEQAGKYSIEIDEEFIDEKYTIYLEDNYQGKTVNLKDGAYYFKVQTAGEFNDRFKLHYTKSPLVLDVDKSVKKELELMVYVDAAKQLNVDLKNTSAKIKHIQLFDLLGREIRSFLPNDLMNISNLSTGIYIVSVRLDSNQKINKKIVIFN